MVFIVVLQELHCLLQCLLHVCIIRVSLNSPSFICQFLIWCLLLFYKNYIVYYNVYYMFVSSEFLSTHQVLFVYTFQFLIWCLLLFYKNYIVYYNVYCDYSLERSFILIDSRFSELHVHLCPYCNVWPEAVY